MEGFIHLKMPLWARRLFTRLLSVIPVIMCVLMTAKDSISQQHFALNMLLENSQVFLAFAVPFSIVPLLIMTDDRRMMGQFKNRKIWSILGWVSSIIKDIKTISYSYFFFRISQHVQPINKIINIMIA